MMVIDNAFSIGEIVYLKTDLDQRPRIIVKINVTAQGLLYMLACGSSESWHYEIEISAVRDVLQTLMK